LNDILQETLLSLTNRATRLEVSQGHQTIRYVKYGFLLVCYIVTLIAIHESRSYIR